MGDTPTLNPLTLQEETDEERQERQRLTGERGTGVTVMCTPDLSDPSCVQVQHRAVCLMRPYAACGSCRHARFRLLFRLTPERYQMVRCPMWKTPGARLSGAPPDEYVARELGTCADRPFEFCPSCPAREELAALDIDKTREGWYARWRRFKKEMQEDDS